MKINLDELRARKEYINEQRHPTESLIIWNYSHKAQFDRAWDEYVIVCRGLITDLEGNIVARPFPKFFNYEEHISSDKEGVVSIYAGKIPSEIPEITEKLDGSLGILYFVNNIPYIATRGSFTSEQATWATRWVHERFSKEDFVDGYTYLFEIIYPENRIVVDYKGYEGLTLLAVINTDTGEELDVREVGRPRFDIPTRYNYLDLQDCVDELNKIAGDGEGVVVRYSNGLRLKMKTEEYVRLHRIITGFSTKSLWEALSENQNIDTILQNVPDEFMSWIRIKKQELETRYKFIENMALKIYNECGRYKNRKDKAIHIQATSNVKMAGEDSWYNISGIVFNIIDDKYWRKGIWKLLRPKYELPFKQNE